MPLPIRAGVSAARFENDRDTINGVIDYMKFYFNGLAIIQKPASSIVTFIKNNTKLVFKIKHTRNVHIIIATRGAVMAGWNVKNLHTYRFPVAKQELMEVCVELFSRY